MSPPCRKSLSDRGRSLVGHVIEAAAHRTRARGGRLATVRMVVEHRRDRAGSCRSQDAARHRTRCESWTIRVRACVLTDRSWCSPEIRSSRGNPDRLMSAHSGACTVLTATVASPTGPAESCETECIVAIMERDATDEQRPARSTRNVFESPSSSASRASTPTTLRARSTTDVGMITADGVAHVSPTR